MARLVLGPLGIDNLQSGVQPLLRVGHNQLATRTEWPPTIQVV